MLKLGYTPNACCWVHRRGQAMGLLAMYVEFNCRTLSDTNKQISSERGTGTIRIYDGRGDGKPLETLDKLHRFSVHIMTVRQASISYID